MTGIHLAGWFGSLTHGKFMAVELYMLEASWIEEKKRIQTMKGDQEG
jgi:hypothetical protein